MSKPRSERERRISKRMTYRLRRLVRGTMRAVTAQLCQHINSLLLDDVQVVIARQAVRAEIRRFVREEIPA